MVISEVDAPTRVSSEYSTNCAILLSMVEAVAGGGGNGGAHDGEEASVEVAVVVGLPAGAGPRSDNAIGVNSVRFGRRAIGTGIGRGNCTTSYWLVTTYKQNLEDFRPTIVAHQGRDV
jgi:hypothetical protein